MIDQSSFRTKGVHIFTKCKIESNKAAFYQEKLNWVSKQFNKIKNVKDTKINVKAIQENLNNEFKYWKGLLEKEFKTFELAVENVTTVEGRNVFARLLANDNTYSGNVSHTALGTSNSAASTGDTALGAETYRKAISSATALNNVAYLETFFTAAEVNGTFEEYGNFIDGSGTADSGQLFNRFTQTVIKSAIETLNVQSIITINDN